MPSPLCFTVLGTELQPLKALSWVMEVLTVPLSLS